MSAYLSGYMCKEGFNPIKNTIEMATHADALKRGGLLDGSTIYLPSSIVQHSGILAGGAAGGVSGVVGGVALAKLLPYIINRKVSATKAGLYGGLAGAAGGALMGGVIAPPAWMAPGRSPLVGHANKFIKATRGLVDDARTIDLFGQALGAERSELPSEKQIKREERGIRNAAWLQDRYNELTGN